MREGVFGVPKKVAGVIGRVKEKDLLVFHLLSKKRKGICGIGEVVSNPYEDNRNLWGRNRYPVRLQVVIIRNFAKERLELIPLSFLYDQNKNNGIIVEPFLQNVYLSKLGPKQARKLLSIVNNETN